VEVDDDYRAEFHSLPCCLTLRCLIASSSIASLPHPLSLHCLTLHFYNRMHLISFIFFLKASYAFYFLQKLTYNILAHGKEQASHIRLMSMLRGLQAYDKIDCEVLQFGKSNLAGQYSYGFASLFGINLKQFQIEKYNLFLNLLMKSC
jgi:hypothetical protein